MEKGFTIITGGNSGNGKAIALTLNKLGYPLLILDLKTNDVEKEISNNVMFANVDVTNYSSFEKEIRKGEIEFGPVVNMINNAGVMILEKADIQPVEQMSRMIDINFKGVVYGTQIALKSMKSNKRGTIINISSIAGIKGFDSHSVYCGTKFAVRGYSETVRAEVASEGIRVSVISPGVVKTNLLEGTTNKEIKEGYEEWRDEAKAFISADDIANSIVYILKQPKNVTLREIVIGPTTQVE